MGIHEMYGQKAEELEVLSAGFQQTLQLLRDLKAGITGLEDLEISDQGWSITSVSENGSSEQPVPDLVEDA